MFIQTLLNYLSRMYDNIISAPPRCMFVSLSLLGRLHSNYYGYDPSLSMLDYLLNSTKFPRVREIIYYRECRKII